MTNKLGVYIHIPFCVRKCNYCDFLSFAAEGARTEVFAAYQNALLREIAQTDLGAYNLDTVYIGGGTPSVLPPAYIAELLQAVRGERELAHAEITLEVNPGTVVAEAFAVYRAAGVNRLCFGLQSTHDAELARLGRIHSYSDFLDNYHAARQQGFTNISVDLMHSLPGQGVAEWDTTLRRVAAFQPEHISVYGLTVEENTAFGRQLAAGALCLPDENLDREMYALAVSALRDAGYVRYEISNFAKPGFASRHNMKYWTRGEYVGFGLGAHSFMNSQRWRNTRSMEEYLAQQGLPEKIRREVTPITCSEAMAEFMFLGLRMAAGVSEAAFYESFGCELREIYDEPIQKHIGNGLLMSDGGRLWLSARGVDLSNVVMADFL